MNWRRAVLAAGAGLASLAVCSGATVTIFVLLISAAGFFAPAMSSSLLLMGTLFIMAIAWSGFWLPIRALGARGSQAATSVVLSGLTFLLLIALFILPIGPDDATKEAYALLAFTGVPAVFSTAATWPLVATKYQFALTVIAATAAPYALSLWVAHSVADPSNSYVYGCAVASASWLLLPALAGAHRSAQQEREASSRNPPTRPEA